MSENESWEALDGAVFNSLLGPSDITSQIDLLQSEIYKHASFLFGFVKKWKNWSKPSCPSLYCDGRSEKFHSVPVEFLYSTN